MSAGCCGSGPAPDARFARVLWVALAVNATMFVVEVIASLLSGSMALQADALDFLGDSASYAISLVVLPMGLAARATAAAVKGLAMAVFGLWVLGATLFHTLSGASPAPLAMGQVMGLTGLLALAANVGVTALLFRYRAGDANMRSIWLCSRNDVVANLAVILAAAGVLATGSRWPDLVVAAVIAVLCLHAAIDVLTRARAELAETRAGTAPGDAVPELSSGPGD